LTHRFVLEVPSSLPQQHIQIHDRIQLFQQRVVLRLASLITTSVTLESSVGPHLDPVDLFQVALDFSRGNTRTYIDRIVPPNRSSASIACYDFRLEGGLPNRAPFSAPISVARRKLAINL
jgi:hypothetical protein